MNFPACKHRRTQRPTETGLRWLAAEPFRFFFISGALWSIVGVSLWPLYFWRALEFYPNYCHARLMIEAFGGAFVIGFLGTAGPRMASAPKLTPWEFVWLAVLHEAVGVLHLTLRHSMADSVFAILLLSLMVSLAGRVIRFRKQPPPPQMLLALTGLLCGVAGSMLSVRPATLNDPSLFHLSSLMLYQGLLLPPVLGVGSFIFPRILGGGFGEPATPGAKRAALIHALLAALAIVASFFIEAFGSPMAGGLIRACVVIIYLIAEIPWFIKSSEPKGSFVPALYAALLSGVMGLISASLFDLQRIALDHLLYIGGFGLLIVVVASRVLFGHGGRLADFQRRSKMVRWLWGLTLLAALTRVTPGLLPQLAISHYQYAALTWSAVMLLWLGWHRRRFAQREVE